MQWFAQDQTLDMQWELEAGLCQIQEKVHWEAVKWILRYLRGTIDKCLYFGKGELKVQGYVDADFGGEIDNKKAQHVMYLQLETQQ